MNMTFWDVYLGKKLIDSVPYEKGCDKEYVRKSLIEHDGYDPRIQIKKSKSGCASKGGCGLERQRPRNAVPLASLAF